MSKTGNIGDRWADVTLRTKVTIVTVFILFLGLIVAGVGTFSVLRPMLLNQQAAELSQLRNDPTRILTPGADTSELIWDDIVAADGRFYVAMLDTNGDVTVDNARGRNPTQLPDLGAYSITLDRVQNDPSALLQLKSASGTTWRAVAIELLVSGEPGAVLLIAESTTSINQVVAQYIIVFTGFGIAVILLGAALTRILITTTLLPLAEVEQTALDISRGDFSKRIMVSSPHTEVGHLGESLNIMLDQLDGSIEEREQTIQRMRRFIGDAGHELRTPLVTVRGYAELHRMGALQEKTDVEQAMGRIEKEAIRMTSLVEDLLALARLDERRPLDLRSLPLNQFASDAALDARASAPDREVTVHEDDAQPYVLGDEHKVRQLMTNLIGNAMQHTPDGSPIDIVVTALPTAEGASAMARFEIVDHGEGVPEQIRDKIFDRFWRADSSRNRETGGSGLGLSIVKSIVEAHHGRISVHETPGGGATFRVDLPAASA